MLLSLYAVSLNLVPTYLGKVESSYSVDEITGQQIVKFSSVRTKSVLRTPIIQLLFYSQKGEFVFNIVWEEPYSKLIGAAQFEIAPIPISHFNKK